MTRSRAREADAATSRGDRRRARSERPPPVRAPPAEASNPPETGRILSVEGLVRLAGLSAVVAALLAAAGILSASAYLSAWSVPPTMISLDPVTAAVRAESTVYVFALLGVSLIALINSYRRWATTGRRRMIFLGVTGALVVFAVASSLAAGRYSGILIYLGAFLLFIGRVALNRLSMPVFIAAVAILGLVAAYVGGREFGAAYRTDPAARTPITVTTPNPIAGLPGGTQVGETWQYDGLYLIFRDSQSLFVGADGEDRAWAISLTRLVSVGIGE